MKQTMLIFGVSSFIGSNLLELLKDEYRVIGTFHKTPVSVPGVTCIPCDVLKKEYVSNIIARFRPDLTIYAVGMNSLKDCQKAPKQSDAINSAGAVNCCVASDRYDSKFIYLSSGFVLSGEDATYREGETPFPNTAYGNSLSSTEFYIQRSSLNYLILRCSSLYGRGFNSLHSNWFEYMQGALAKNEPFLANSTVHTGFLDIQLLSKILKGALDLNITNRLLHVSSKDFMTRYDFARLYARIFRKDEELVQKTSVGFPVDKSKNSDANNFYYRLDTSNIEALLNTNMPTVEESLQLTYKRLKSSNLT